MDDSIDNGGAAALLAISAILGGLRAKGVFTHAEIGALADSLERSAENGSDGKAATIAASFIRRLE